ncbi:MAG: hypothetical protein V3U11_03385, partial [Planctomycetota bacterium]
DEVGVIYSGASRVTAELKDRLHHLDYYLASISRSRPQLQELQRELGLAELPQQIGIVEEFQQLCAQRTVVGQEDSVVRGKSGCQGFYRTMQDLVREFPHTDKATRPAMDALGNALQAITSMAWDLIDAARERLEATPLPIRPVQSLVNRLDRLRLLKAFVDQPGHSRAYLLEEIEWVRMRLDQARATRDQLARGAQESEQKGHLTTALYDMARAVNSLSADIDEDDDGPSVEQLRQQYMELKHKKERLEQATEDSRRLAAWYHELQGRDDSHFNDRVQALEQRAEVLELLLANVAEDRATLLASDLREVQIQLVREHAEEGDRQLVKATTAQAQLECAESTLARLRREAPPTGGTRVGRTLDHWTTHVEQAKEAVRKEQAEEIRATWQKRRTTFIRVAVVLLVVGSGFFFFQETFGGERPMANLLESLNKTTLSKHQIRRIDNEIYYPRLQACVELQGFVGRLEDLEPDPLGGGIVTAARNLVDDLQRLAEAPAGAACLDWVPRVRAQLSIFMEATKAQKEHIYSFQDGGDVLAKLDEFARVAHLTGINMAATLPDAWALTLENVLRRQHDLGVAAISAEDIDSVLRALRPR